MAVEAKEQLNNVEIPEALLSFLPVLVGAPLNQVWASYDEEADVAYFNFRMPAVADDSSIRPDGTIFRYFKKELVGITVLDASKYRPKKR